ncbi:hypothetical protein [Hyphomonas sp.]|uniref:hypothetical protein n=1 Tax=Hyphomonas sp. TaxID=87 RepID=UPI0025BBA8E4|nr:hypothetical protein [Hyphomonas sp.]
MKRLAYTTLAVLCSSPAAGACVSVNVENKSDYKLHVVWQALGCIGIDGDTKTPFTCASHDISPHKSRSHNFDWGKSSQTVIVYFDGINNAEGHQVVVDFAYVHSKHTFVRHDLSKGQQMPNGCHKHYTIHYTNEDIISDSETAFQNSKKK